VEVAEGYTHDGGVGYGVQYLGDEQFFPEVAANEEPVKKGVLEQEPEGEHEFAFEDGAVTADGKGEHHHGECRHGRHGEPQLQHIGEQASLRGAFAKVGEDERRHAKVGDGAKNGIVALQNAKVPKIDNSQVVGDNILHKHRNALDENVHQRNEYANLYVLEYFQRGIK